jgi:hypothetical protein
MPKHLQLVILLLTTTLWAMAEEPASRIYRSGGEWIEEVTGTLAAGKNVKVKTQVGPIHIQGGQQNTVTFTIHKHVRAGSEEAARRELGRLRVVAYTTSDGAIIRSEGEGVSRVFMDFDIHVPSQTAFVKLETNGGAVSANGISGKVEANTGGGAIHLDQIGGSISAASGGGDIGIGKVGGDVRVETGGGTIQIESAGGQIVASSRGGTLLIGTGSTMKLQTGGGSIKVSKCTGAINASSGGGAIELNDVGAAQVATGGGSIRVTSVHGGLRAETGGGAIVAELAAGKGAFTDSRLETPAGDIVVYIPDNLGVNIRAAVEVPQDSGISSDFPELRITRSNEKWGPREAFAEGSLNGGGPVLHVHTTNGHIEFKRKKQ